MKKLRQTIFFVLLFVACAPNVSENENQNDESTWGGSACSMSEDSIHIKANGSVIYNISTDIKGFQFKVDGATVLGGSGGAAGDADGPGAGGRLGQVGQCVHQSGHPGGEVDVAAQVALPEAPERQRAVLDDDAPVGQVSLLHAVLRLLNGQGHEFFVIAARGDSPVFAVRCFGTGWTRGGVMCLIRPYTSGRAGCPAYRTVETRCFHAR